MSKQKSTVWKCAPHTIVKHRILRNYLNAWFPILAKYNGRIVYVDGFSGPGEYENGEKGSPIVALEAALAQEKHLSHAQISFEFIEQDPERAENLNEAISKIVLPNNFDYNIDQGKFHDIVNQSLDVLDVNGGNNAPIFAFIDPFGFSGVPYSILERLLSYDKTEVFVYFARNSINRFVNVPSVEQHIRDLFGLEIVEIPAGENRLQFLKDLYQRQLAQIARYVGSFTMTDGRNVPIYDLFFASNNTLGYLKMKEAMWRVDETGGFKFSYRDIPEQQILFPVDPVDTLVRDIREAGRNRKNIKVENIERYVIEKTIFLPKHMKEALKRLEELDVIAVHKIKTDGKPRRKGTFPTEVLVDFN